MRKNITSVFVCVVALTLGSACGSSSSSSTGSSGSGSGSGGSGGSSGLNITGTVAAANLAISPAKAASSSSAVTDVLAVSPEASDASCVTVEVGTDGTFTLPISSGRLWALFFFNRFQTGSSMFSGWFRTPSFDALAPNVSTGDIGLGTVTVDTGTQTASSSRDDGDILTDLDLDTSTAETLNDIDDMTGRYANPDKDSDGEIDCNQTNSNFMLDFHIRYYLPVSGTNATVTDIIDNYLSTDTTTTSYSSTGVYISYLNTYSSATSGTVTFNDSNVTVENGTTYTAGTAISDDAADNSFGNYNSFGVNMKNTSELPSGGIVFTFGGKTVTFSNVQTPSLAAINAPSGRLFIFIKFNKADSACTSSCTLSGLSYKWMKKTAAGWTTPTLAEISTIVASGTPNLGFRVNNDSARQIGVSIPTDALSGTIPWSTSNYTLTGTTTSEFENLVTTQICHIGLAYDDKIGMRYFHNIDNAPGTCP